MSTLTLSGWGQPHDALLKIAPGAQVFAYARHAMVEEALAALHQYHGGVSRVVGWSLGGLLAVQAIARGILKPKQLVLIATPYRFANIPNEGLGMPRDAYEQFAANFAADPERTLKRAWQLVSKGDARARAVQQALQAQDAASVLQYNWGAWFAALDQMPQAEVAWNLFPPTLLIHGDRDAVVEPAQSQRYAALLPSARVETIEGAGHAPHWHDPARLAQLVAGAHV